MTEEKLVNLKDYPELYKKLSKTNNKKVFEEKVSIYEDLEWDCVEGKEAHSFKKSIKRMLANSNCKYCSKKAFCKGINDIETLYPSLVKSFDVAKNNNKAEDCIASGSKYFWWRCLKDHSYRAKLIWRIEGMNCPYCSNHKVLAEFNDVASDSKLSKYYSEKLNSISSDKILASSTKLVWWECELDHSWKNTPSILKEVKNPCPYCSNRKFLAGFNDLKTLFPKLSESFDESKNKILSSQQKTFGVGLVWWSCRYCGLSWKASLDSRIRGAGCPGCSGRVAIPGKTDLLTSDPYIASLFDLYKNSIDISALKRWSTVKVWWLCSEGHSFEETVRNQVRSGYCRHCLKESSFRSFLEYRVHSLVKDILKDSTDILINSRDIIAPLELDLFFPKLGKAIEVNGDYWHSEEFFRKSNKKETSKDKDDFKKKLCEDRGIELLFVGEEEFNFEYEIVVVKLRKFLTSVSNSKLTK